MTIFLHQYDRIHTLKNSVTFVCGKSDPILTSSNQILEMPGNTANHRFVFPVSYLFYGKAQVPKSVQIFQNFSITQNSQENNVEYHQMTKKTLLNN